jgi:hypothetical protein
MAGGAPEALLRAPSSPQAGKNGGNLTNSMKDLWVFVDKSMLKPVKNRNFLGQKMKIPTAM